MANIAGAGGGGSVYGRPRPTPAQPQAKPYAKPTLPASEVVPFGTPPKMKPISVTPVGGGKFGSGYVRYQYRPDTPKKMTQADVLFHQASGAIGNDVLKKASNPRVAGLQTVLGDLSGIPPIVDALRSGHHLGPAAVSAAGFLPFGKFGKVAEELANLAKAGEEIRPVASAVAKIQKGLPPTAPTLGESVTGALKGGRSARSVQETLRSEERAIRLKGYGKQAQQDPSLAGHRAALSQLAGRLPALNFEGFKEFSPEAFDAMSKHITDHPGLTGYEPLNAKNALLKIQDGKIPTKSEERVLRKAFGHATTNNLMKSVSTFHQLKSLGYDIANIPRSVMASYDASGIMRQGLLLGLGHPVIFSKNVGAYFKAIKSEDFYNAGIEGLRSRPNAVNGVYEKAGVDFTELTPRASAAAREESFRSPLAEKIPGVRQSGRGFTLFLDVTRADVFDSILAKAARTPGYDVHDQHLLESVGSFVNSASGRGDWGDNAIGRSQEALNLFLFSPRLIKSRVDFLNPFWYKSLHPLARHEAYKAMGGLVMLVATADAIAQSVGAKVNLDPRSSDFAKIKIGNTRLDLAGGFLQYGRLLSELVTQQVVNSAGKTTDLGQEGPGKTSDFDVLLRFIRSKTAPLTSLSWDVSQQHNIVGQPLTWKNTVLSRMTPLSGQDAVSVGQDAGSHGLPAGIAAGVAAFGLSAIGGGVQNYKPKVPKVNPSRSRTYGQGSSGGSSYGSRSSSGSVYGKR